MYILRTGIPLGVLLLLLCASASRSIAQTGPPPLIPSTTDTSISPQKIIIVPDTSIKSRDSTNGDESRAEKRVDSTANARRDSVSADTANAEKQGGIGAPFLQYSPETGLAGGLTGIYYFHLSQDSAMVKRGRPSNVAAGFTITTKHQFTSGLGYDFYLDSDRYHLIGGFDYKRYPFDFYGIGNNSPVTRIDNYTPLWIGGDMVFTVKLLQTPVGNGLNIGTEIEIRNDKILSSQDGGILKTGNIPGAHGGLTSGLGYNLGFDARDNVYSTHRGQYAYFSAMYYGKQLGSAFNYNRYTLDLRSFTPIFTTHTLAFQTLLVVVKGLEPFYSMAGLGGILNMRGYYQGRFRDNNMAVFQAEYRMPVWWRFGVVGFGDIGQVAGSITGFKMNAFKYTFGAGLRILIIPKEHLGVRLDYGIGSDSREIYFSILEAF